MPTELLASAYAASQLLRVDDNNAGKKKRKRAVKIKDGDSVSSEDVLPAHPIGKGRRKQPAKASSFLDTEKKPRIGRNMKAETERSSRLGERKDEKLCR